MVAGPSIRFALPGSFLVPSPFPIAIALPIDGRVPLSVSIPVPVPVRIAVTVVIPPVASVLPRAGGNALVAGADSRSMIDDAEAVFFDIGGVVLDLRSVRKGHRQFVAELAAEYDLDAERALDTWRDVLGSHFRARRGTEFRSAAEGYSRAVEAAVGTEVPNEEWRPVFDRVTDETLRPVDGAYETLDRLSDEFYLGVISDIDAWEAERILGGFGTLDFFDGVTTSETVGRTKPDPAVFAAAIGKAGVDPSRSVMIGDRYHNDMRGGSWAGLHTVALGGSAATGPGRDRDGSNAETDEISGETAADGGDEDEPDTERDPDGVVDYRITDPREVIEIVDLDGTE